MSHLHSLPNDESTQSRDPRRRDRSRSEIRRSDDTDILSSSLTSNPPLRQEQSTPKTTVIDFFKTLGINSQLIQALINANPPQIEQVQPQQPQTVNNAQEFASFLSQSYGLDPRTSSTPNPSVNRDPRRRHISTETTPVIPITSTDNTPVDISSRFHQSTESPLVSRTSHTSLSIDESYKQYLRSIDQSLLDDETRKRFQRIALLDNELDKLHRMNIELTKTTEKRSRRRSSTKDKDPLLKENENLQTELIEYIKTLKTTIMMHYPTYIFSNRQQ